MTLTGYFTRAFAGRFLAVLLAFAGLLQLLDLLDKASAVLERGRGAADVLTYVGLRLPMFLNQLVPLAVLIGALTAFLSLAQHNEIVALRSVGASPWRLLRSLLPTVAVIAALHVLLLDQIVPRAEQALQDWWAARPAPATDDKEPAKPVWIRAGAGIASITAVHDGGRRLDGVTVVLRDEEGLANGRLTAREARWEDGGWTLHEVDTLTILPNGVQRAGHRDRMPWPDGPAPENVAFVANPTEFLSVRRILSIMEGAWSGTRNRAYYETQVQKLFSIPASSFVMLLLAQPALHGIRRGGALGSGLAAGLALGLLFLVFQGFLSALAEADALPPALAVWLPLALFACIGGAVLLYLEE
ncbi:LPS export ABC transporter permease LptG [Azospirillum sp.]|uniref:LPS export ABC transporter permease LptG n=1 Tax=Azospirillum sp. TaxID=34012 RepID=UPI002D604BBA|nr:LPS export ABC transporter permease LptG [Azospirillum sp.]HYD68176.1 LPS export ABC transporter permease LptG [Azospirillum sp.]